MEEEEERIVASDMVYQHLEDCYQREYWRLEPQLEELVVGSRHIRKIFVHQRD